MKDKINWKECMKRKCEQCKYYNRYFKEKMKKTNAKNRRTEMKKLKFLVDVPDKYTREDYKAGQIKQFTNKRAEEILNAKRSNGEPYAILVENKKETATKKIKKETAIKE